MAQTRLMEDELEVELTLFLLETGAARFFNLISNAIKNSEMPVSGKAVLLPSPNKYTLTLINSKLRDTFAGEMHDLITGDYNVVSGENKNSVLVSLIGKGTSAEEL